MHDAPPFFLPKTYLFSVLYYFSTFFSLLGKGLKSGNWRPSFISFPINGVPNLSRQESRAARFSNRATFCYTDLWSE